MKSTGQQLKLFKSSIFIVIGAFLAGFGINGFLLSSHFIDGGVTGISMLVSSTSGLPIQILLIIINIPFIFMAYKQMGSAFAIKSIIAILLLSVFLLYIPYPDVTPDKLLTAVFGGFFIGTGIGFAMRGGAVLDGTEIAALIINKNFSFVKVSDVILLLNVVIFLTAVFFLGTEPALYSILTYFTASKMIDFVVDGIEEYIGVTIISEKSIEIREMIINKMNRGVTVYKSQNGFGKSGETDEKRNIIFTVMTRLEVGRLQSEIDELDSKAFIVYQSINDIKGGKIKNRSFH